MSTIAEIVAPAESFALRETLNAAAEFTVKAEQTVSHSSDHSMPYVWISGGTPDAFDAVLPDDPSVEDATRVDEVDGAALYRVAWSSETETVCHAYTRSNATILEAIGERDQWRLQLRFDSQSDIEEFQDDCAEHGVPFELTRLYDPSEPMIGQPDPVVKPADPVAGGQFGLTSEQRTALIDAMEAGYFDIPRGATSKELAAQLGISHQALSERLRRGHTNLIRNALARNAPTLD